MGNIGIALGGKAISVPAWFILSVIVLAIIGIRHILRKTRN